MPADGSTRNSPLSRLSPHYYVRTVTEDTLLPDAFLCYKESHCFWDLLAALLMLLLTENGFKRFQLGGYYIVPSRTRHHTLLPLPGSAVTAPEARSETRMPFARVPDIHTPCCPKNTHVWPVFHIPVVKLFCPLPIHEDT